MEEDEAMRRLPPCLERYETRFWGERSAEYAEGDES
jgi:hypothetical protein